MQGPAKEVDECAFEDDEITASDSFDKIAANFDNFYIFS